MLRDLKNEQLPKSNDIDFDEGWKNDGVADSNLGEIVTRWRYQRR